MDARLGRIGSMPTVVGGENIGLFLERMNIPAISTTTTTRYVDAGIDARNPGSRDCSRLGGCCQ